LWSSARIGSSSPSAAGTDAVLEHNHLRPVFFCKPHDCHARLPGGVFVQVPDLVSSRRVILDFQLQANALLPFLVNGCQKPVPAMVQGLAVHEPRGSQSPVPKRPHHR
jgi:hypothetical protein